MFSVSVRDGFSAAHNLRGYEGNCEKLHGHNWRVEAVMEKEQVNDQGMVIDFRRAKELLAESLLRLDHAYLNELPEFQDVNPSSENIARFIFHRLKQALAETGCNLRTVSVWETASSCATYAE